jgi:serine/threonine protein kinase
VNPTGEPIDPRVSGRTSSLAMRGLFDRHARGSSSLDQDTEVDRFVILCELGHGAMGVVYEALDPKLERKVALKLLLSDDAEAIPEAAARRLLQEAQALAKLSHPNVVTVHDVGIHDGRVWLAMEFVDGQTLLRWARQLARVESELDQPTQALEHCQRAIQIRERVVGPDHPSLAKSLAVLATIHGQQGRVGLVRPLLERSLALIAAKSQPPADRADIYFTLAKALWRSPAIVRVRVHFGAGNMGVVHAAHDPDLDRKVAVKLIRRASRRAGTSGGTRLLREAQALARLSHPNIVAVHDVGVRGTQVWIAMEFVAGLTLRDWAATPRSVAGAVRALTESARGVAAAHAAGVVHRDLKPDNVMIDDEQRVRVMDFGLAHGRGASPALLGDRGRASPPTALDLRAVGPLTQFGSLPGTPAYMAPEQWAWQDAGRPPTSSRGA